MSFVFNLHQHLGLHVELNLDNLFFWD